jgi:hypothetical protein
MPRTRTKAPARPPRGAVREPEVVPRHLAGMWIAWSPDGMRIIASAPTLEDVMVAARQAGEPDPLVDCAPPPTRQV